MTVELPAGTTFSYTATAAGDVASLQLWDVFFWDEKTNQAGSSASNPALSVTRTQGPVLVDLLFRRAVT